MRTHHTTQSGFTLMELLVVIAIIGVLASFVNISTTDARRKARDAKRRIDLNEIAKALEVYRNDHGEAYPSSGGLTTILWEGACTGITLTGFTNTPQADYIPGLAPTYVTNLPGDPSIAPGLERCYGYASNGTDYFLWAHKGIEGTVSDSDPLKRHLPTPTPACSQIEETFIIGSKGNCTYP